MIPEEKLNEWEKLAVWGLTGVAEISFAPVRAALHEAIDEVRRLSTCERCRARRDDLLPLISDQAHKLIKGKKLCGDCYRELCVLIAKDLGHTP